MRGSPDAPQPVGGAGPRGFVGGLWHELGDLQFRFLVEQGLRPEHVLLDIACGSLRGGVRFIPYLNVGNYLGVDMDRSLIDHGLENEIGRTLCSVKKPELVVSENFEFERLSKSPDFALAQSLFSHLTQDDIRLCLRKLKSVATAQTRFFATFLEVAQSTDNPLVSHPHAGFHYTRAEMEEFAVETGWHARYIGAWNHPRDQKMIEYRLAL
jgi:hypothetical protein